MHLSMHAYLHLINWSFFTAASAPLYLFTLVHKLSYAALRRSLSFTVRSLRRSSWQALQWHCRPSASRDDTDQNSVSCGQNSWQLGQSFCRPSSSSMMAVPRSMRRAISIGFINGVYSPNIVHPRLNRVLTTFKYLNLDF